jgi:hypothetical protein
MTKGGCVGDNEVEVVDEETEEKRARRRSRLLSNLHLPMKKYTLEKTEQNNNDKNNNEVLGDICMDVPDSSCFYCGDEASMVCSHCKQVSYCSQEHYCIHRPDNYCFPFTIKTSPTVGRYCIATRDIQPCELILREEPAAVGPYKKTNPVCLQCFKKVDGSYLCPRCNFPMCDAECATGKMHRQECDFFVSKSFKISMKTFNKPNSGYFCITPLRMLLKKSSEPLTYNRINTLIDHIEERNAASTCNVNLTQMSIIMFLSKSCNMTEFTEQEIQRMIGILRTNGMTLGLNQSRDCPGVALYPIYCLLNHACENNTNYVKYKDFHLELRSQKLIKKGEEITTRYVTSTYGNMRRRRDIKKYWFFDCHCKRCCDPTEMGTCMSSVRCFTTSCPGHLLPCNSLDYDTSWVCDKCHTEVAGDIVSVLIDNIEKTVESADKSKPENVEEMLFRFSHQLHPNHYILLEMEHSLVHVYGNQPKLTRPEKERKIQLCHHVLEILGLVDPGYTKWRGVLIHQLIQPLIAISKDDYKTRIISERQLKRRLHYCMVMMANAKKCLSAGFSPGETS